MGRCRPAKENDSTLTTGPERNSSASTEALPASTWWRQTGPGPSASITRRMCRLAAPSTGLRMMGPPTSARKSSASRSDPTTRCWTGLSSYLASRSASAPCP